MCWCVFVCEALCVSEFVPCIVSMCEEALYVCVYVCVRVCAVHCMCEERGRCKYMCICVC